ncbi:MAG: CTP synthase [Blautia sp.]|nr:CTP synthase [Clostridia bacterium]MDY4693486.1 CTP synthase [Blautia sp.]MDY5554032.1 CTP synthase [Blautia sp.]
MSVKYVFVTGGVVSGLGKGITAASLGRLLKARGYQVTMQKFDPYINIDPGTMNPIQHGEVFVTDDGTETDLDLGHYERFIDESLDKNSNVTTGKVYWSVLQKERHGDFGGGTVQVIPHITNEIKSRFYHAKSPDENKIAIIEVGGTVGDIESQPFLEAIRQFQHEVGRDNAIMLHVTLIPYLKASEEMKTKPTQASVKELQGMGIQPDVLVCRSEHPLTDEIRQKIALFCNVPVSHVLQNLDVEYLYEAPLAMEREKLADVVLSCLRLENRKPDLSDWEEMVESLKNPDKTVKIAIVGKYTQLHDAYLSVVEALKHGGISCRAKVELEWVDSEELTEKNLDQRLHDVHGILVPGGFGNRGTEGMILAAQYARIHKIPYLGICLGMQMAIVEFARHILGYADANSIELDPETKHPVIALMPDQEDIEDIGGTLRLGSYPCILAESSISYKLFGTREIHERHRHRYEVNNAFREELQEKGMDIAGTSPDGHIVEMIEISGHPFFVGTQAHPEFKSRPNHAHPLFRGFIQAAVEKAGEERVQ